MAQATLHAALLKIAQNEGFKDVEIVMDESPNHGYLASVNKVTLVEANCKDGRRLHLFAKRNPGETKNNDLEFLYENEAVFYDKVAKVLQEVVENSNVSAPRLPKCYFASKDLLVLEDLMEGGFSVWNPLNKALDKTHVKAVLEAYGKFHAFSFALKHKHPEKFDSIGIRFEWFDTQYDRLTENGYWKSLTEKLASAFDEETEFHYIETIAAFMSDRLREFLQTFIPESPNDVFIHGDNWTHNYMFKYGENGNVVKDVCLVDFQISRKTSPVADLSYFFCTAACTQEIFDTIYDYLKIYHQSVEKQLKELNCPTSVYTWDAFIADWKKWSIRGFLMGAMVLKMMIADEDELEAHKHIPLPMQFDFVSRNEALYHEKMRIIIKHFYDAGFFNF